jgi:predicted metal-dependent phosphoesterase TrpH
MDCAMSLEDIVARCLEIGINCLGIADHNKLEGALKMKELAPFAIVPGEEILTLEGEVIGFFLSKEIPSKLSMKETIARIKKQGGLVCIPHPYDRLRFSAFKDRVFDDIMSQVDIIEAFNARSLAPGGNTKALELARKYSKPAGAGSDAHTLPEIGNAYVEMADFNSKKGFLDSLAKGTIYGNRSNPAAHFVSTWNKLKKRWSQET